MLVGTSPMQNNQCDQLNTVDSFSTGCSLGQHRGQRGSGAARHRQHRGRGGGLRGLRGGQELPPAARGEEEVDSG